MSHSNGQVEKTYSHQVVLFWKKTMTRQAHLLVRSAKKRVRQLSHGQSWCRPEERPWTELAPHGRETGAITPPRDESTQGFHFVLHTLLSKYTQITFIIRRSSYVLDKAGSSLCPLGRGLACSRGLRFLPQLQAVTNPLSSASNCPRKEASLLPLL